MMSYALHLAPCTLHPTPCSLEPRAYTHLPEGASSNHGLLHVFRTLPPFAHGKGLRPLPLVRLPHHCYSCYCCCYCWCWCWCCYYCPAAGVSAISLVLLLL